MSEIFIVRLGNVDWLGIFDNTVQMNQGIHKVKRYKTLNGARRGLSRCRNQGLVKDERLAGIYQIDTSKPYLYPEKITNHSGKII